jgi:hypothetical protein
MSNHRGNQARSNGRQARYTGPRSRAGLLATPRMDFGSMLNAEAILFAGGVNLAPMSLQPQTLSQVVAMGSISFIPTAGLSDLQTGALSGVVVPGAEAVAGSEIDVAMDEIIRTAAERKLPIMAFGEGVSRTLKTLNLPVPEVLPAALLIHNGVVPMETEDDLRAAVRVFH